MEASTEAIAKIIANPLSLKARELLKGLAHLKNESINALANSETLDAAKLPGMVQTLSSAYTSDKIIDIYDLNTQAAYQRTVLPELRSAAVQYNPRLYQEGNGGWI